MSDTHMIPETLENVEIKALDVRKDHKEYCITESFYEGPTPFEAAEGFDKEVLDTPAYRVAFMMARRNSVFSDDSSVTAVETYHSRFQRQPTVDLLLDQLSEQRNSGMGDAGSVDGDEIGDLINLVDDFISWTETPSVRLKDLEWLCSAIPTVPAVPDHVDEDTLPTTRFEGGSRMEWVDGNETGSRRPLSLVLNKLTAQDYIDEIAEHESSRDSGYTSSTSPGFKIKIGSSDHLEDASRTPEMETTAAFSTPEEKILVCTSDHNFGPSSPATTIISFLDLNSPTRSGAATHKISTNNDTLSPLSPAMNSPFSERPLPFEHRLNNSSAFVPLNDKDAEDYLLKTMSQFLSSPDPVMRLDWAEDVLRHCTISTAHAIRMAKMDPESNSGNHVLSEVELKLIETAIDVVKVLQHARNGRAYYLSAKYFESGEEKEALHLLAYRNGYPRSLLFLGRLSEDRKLIEEAKKRYEDAAAQEDAACLHLLAQAHLNGHLGVKKDKQTGISLLRRAAASADKDCPDPLYDLALLHLEPPPSKLRSGFKLSNSKPLVAYDPSTAVELLHKAALLDHAPSQLRLGQLYLAGHTDISKRNSRKAPLRRDSYVCSSTASEVLSEMETNSTLARHYLHLAARRGLAEADYEIAREIVMSTDDTSKLTKEHAYLAVAHASRALFDKVPLAYGIMGKIYEHGIGTKKNLEKAEKLYFEGGKKGDTWARKRSDELRNRGVGVSGTDALYKREES